MDESLLAGDGEAGSLVWGRGRHLQRDVRRASTYMIYITCPAGTVRLY